MKLKQSMFDMNEFKRNVKVLLPSRFLLRGSFGGDDTSVVSPTPGTTSTDLYPIMLSNIKMLYCE